MRIRGHSRPTPTKYHSQTPSVVIPMFGTVSKDPSWEFIAEDIQQCNDFSSDLILSSETNVPPEQRNLQIRTKDSLRHALQLRSNVAQSLRNFLIGGRFQEIETPILFKSTPEGAREFLVPTRQKGMAYALPQSPQQYKQLLMSSGIPKYFQFARCFRDEDMRADRQPEFTQVSGTSYAICFYPNQ